MMDLVIPGAREVACMAKGEHFTEQTNMAKKERKSSLAHALLGNIITNTGLECDFWLIKVCLGDVNPLAAICF